MRWFAILLMFGVVSLGIEPVRAKDLSTTAQQTSFCESFGIQRFEIEKEAPAFSLQDLNGKQIPLNRYSGRPLLLFFWASWCQACKEDIALLERYVEKNGAQIEILTVAIDGEKERRVKALVKDQRITLPVLLDRKEALARTYGVRMVPTAFLISKEGMLLGMIVGQRDWCAPEAHSAIQEAFHLR